MFCKLLYVYYDTILFLKFWSIFRVLFLRYLPLSLIWVSTRLTTYTCRRWLQAIHVENVGVCKAQHVHQNKSKQNEVVLIQKFVTTPFFICSRYVVLSILASLPLSYYWCFDITPSWSLVHTLARAEFVNCKWGFKGSFWKKSPFYLYIYWPHW